ncbi:MAG: lipoyl synthase [candidate division Zixibacteria bacterium HGW-Zixibacteria-1]|nr:MAG: lipoyl synthase [candidate division Zixibacteria bacterium HGW-Zixibacteria-1]
METNSKESNGKPPWLKVRACGNHKYLEVQSLLKEHNLHTVCQEANCPNRGECFSSGTATFLIMGPNCTRNCSFCNVTPGQAAPIEDEEPARVARTVEILGISHAVITSVTRDDLPDGGAGQFAKVIRAIRELKRDISIEVLTPDFKGIFDQVGIVLDAGPDIFNHNVETVPRLYRTVRPGAVYRRSLEVLRYAADDARAAVKSGLMVGLGETEAELLEVFADLHTAGVAFLTIGQYLSPSKKHHPVIRYYHPSEFEALASKARETGIKSVFSGPLVRSSYHAGEQYRQQ